MPYQTWIADRLRAFGLPVEDYAGWTTRGSSSFNPGGALAHWTAGPCGATGRPSLNTCVNGRADLPGPLCNVYLDRQGVCVVVAAGRANHAGDGGYRGLSGNSSVLGVEAECCNAGDWTEAQLQNYPTLMGALVAGCGRDASWVARHVDWTSRKIDTNDLSLEWFQTGAAAAIAAGGGRPPAVAPVFEEDDDMAQQLTGRWLDNNFCVAVVRGTDDRLYSSWYDVGAGQRVGLNPLPGNEPVTGEFAIINGPGQLDLFTRGSDGELLHWYFNRSGWNGPENWEGLIGEPFPVEVIPR